MFHVTSSRVLQNEHDDAANKSLAEARYFCKSLTMNDVVTYSEKWQDACLPWTPPEFSGYLQERLEMRPLEALSCVSVMNDYQTNYGADGGSNRPANN